MIQQNPLRLSHLARVALLAAALLVAGCDGRFGAGSILGGSSKKSATPADTSPTSTAADANGTTNPGSNGTTNPGSSGGTGTGSTPVDPPVGTVPPSSPPSPATCQPCAVRDWNQFPAIAQVNGATELWVMSDIHGDYQALLKLLTGAGIIASAPATPQQAQWKAGTAAFVVVGDLIDKGPDAPDVLRLMIALQAGARAAGGNVVVTMGNHEAEFLADPANSKASGPDGIDSELTGTGLTPQQIAAGQGDLGHLLRNLPVAARVGDYFFVHGGKTGGQTLDALSKALQSGIEAASGFSAPVLSAADSLLEARLNSASPQWWDATGNATTLLTQWTQALGAKHLVMGHQPGGVGFADGSTRAASKMFKAYGGLLFLVDTGLSVGASGTGGALLHVKNAGTTSETTEEVLPSGAVQAL